MTHHFLKVYNFILIFYLSVTVQYTEIERCVCGCSSTDAVLVFCLKYKEFYHQLTFLNLIIINNNYNNSSHVLHTFATNQSVLSFFYPTESSATEADHLCDERTVSFTLQVALLTLKLLCVWPLILLLDALFHHGLPLQPLDGIQALYRLKPKHVSFWVTNSVCACLIWILCFNLSNAAKDSVYLPVTVLPK